MRIKLPTELLKPQKIKSQNRTKKKLYGIEQNAVERDFDRAGKKKWNYNFRFEKGFCSADDQFFISISCTNFVFFFSRFNVKNNKFINWNANMPRLNWLDHKKKRVKQKLWTKTKTKLCQRELCNLTWNCMEKKSDLAIGIF